jgi:hypothetical protein
VVPVLVGLKGSDFLASRLVFPIFPPGHKEEEQVLDFSKVANLDKRFEGFVTKSVASKNVLDVY